MFKISWTTAIHNRQSAAASLLMLNTIRANLTLLSPRTWVGLVLAWLAWLYVFINYEIYALFPASWGFYIVQPLLWISLAGLSWLAYRSLVHRGAFSQRLALWAILVGLLQSALFFIFSLAFPFGRSPYGHDPLTVLGNLVYVVTFTLAFEVSRAFVGASLGTRYPGRALAGVAIMFALAAIPAAQFSRLGDPATAFSFIGQTVLPALSGSLLATYLAMTGGPLVSAGYMVTLALAEWLPPILPNPPWLVSAFFGTLFPILALYAFNRWLAPAAPVDAGTTQPITVKKRPSGLLITWLVVGVVALGLTGFTNGMFGPRPFLVSGASMNPTFYTGDIVITNPVPASSLTVGDIIRFHKNGIEIVHRIVEIQQGPTGLEIITRGDNNNSNDASIRPDEIDGKTILVIPKVGLVAIGFRNLISLVGGGS